MDHRGEIVLFTPKHCPTSTLGHKCHYPSVFSIALVVLCLLHHPVDGAKDALRKNRSVSPKSTSRKEAPSWRQLPGGPEPRLGHVAVEWRKRFMIIHGGCTTGLQSFYADTWIFDARTELWQELRATGNPPRARCRHAGSMDMRRDQLFIFGGLANSNGEAYNDTFLLDLKPFLYVSVGTNSSSSTDVNVTALLDPEVFATWHSIESVGSRLPTGRFDCSSVIHDGLAIILGGDDHSSVPMWQLHVNTSYGGVWQACDEDCPSMRQGCSIALTHRSTIFDSSSPSSLISTTAAKDLTLGSNQSASWKDLAVLAYGGVGRTSSGSFPKLQMLAVEVDPSFDPFVRVQWKSIEMAGPEPDRAFTAIAIVNGSLVLFGGFEQLSYFHGRRFGHIFGDLMIYAGKRPELQNVWYRSQPTNAPTERWGHSLTHLHVTGRPDQLVLFGGASINALGDVWTLGHRGLLAEALNDEDSDTFSSVKRDDISFGLLIAGLAVSTLMAGAGLILLKRRIIRERNEESSSNTIGSEPSSDRELLLEKLSTVSFNRWERETTRGESKGSIKVDTMSSEVICVEWQQDRCPICYTDFEETETLCVLPCGHVFHPDCVKQWLRSWDTCPLCKDHTIDKLRSRTN